MHDADVTRTAMMTAVSNRTDLSMPPGGGLWKRGAPAESLDARRTWRPHLHYCPALLQAKSTETDPTLAKMII
jgi:hypothetical protein